MSKKCPECRAEMIAVDVDRIVSIGEWEICIGDVPAIQCIDNEHQFFASKELGDVEITAAKHLIDMGVVTGELFRYARKALGFSQKDFAQLLGKRLETISRWETKKQPIPSLVFAVVRALLLDEAIGEDSTQRLLRKHYENVERTGIDLVIEQGPGQPPLVVPFKKTLGRDVEQLVNDRYGAFLEKELEKLKERA